MRNLVLVLLTTTALTSVASAQTAQAPTPPAQPADATAKPAPAPAAAAPAKKPSDFGTVYGKELDQPKAVTPAPKPAPVADAPEPAPKARPKKVSNDSFKPAAPAAPASAAAPAAASGNGLPIGSNQAVGSNAPPKSAPALSPSQQPLDAIQPASVVSDKVLRDVTLPTSDYNEAGKYTPGFVSNNANGPLGDSKSSWRGFKDGQFNITFDGIPFGDANNPSHHSAAYFPGTFLGGVVIDRGPGAASQAGYATFGGTMALSSRQLKDKMSTEIEGSYGNYGTYSGAVTQQTGLIGGNTRAMAQYSYQKTDGALDFGHVDTSNFLLKLDTKINDNWKLTLFGTLGYEYYNQTNALTWAQFQTYGRKYGTLNMDRTNQGFVPFNDTEKRTDMVYAKLDGKLGYGITVSNTTYTYAYDYPMLQNNPQTSATIGRATVGNGGTVQTFNVTNPVGTCLAGGVRTNSTCTTSVTFNGVGANDVTGYKQ
jgi:iron complex outermembrane recepter protein